MKSKAKYIELTATKVELKALLESIDSLSAMIDGLEDDGTMRKDIRSIDRMLKRSGYKRKYS